MPTIPVRTPPTIKPAAKVESQIPQKPAPKIPAKPVKAVEKAAPKPVEKAVKVSKPPKVAPKVAPAKAVTEKVVKSARPATDNVVPKVETIKSRHWSEDAITFARLLIALKAAQAAILTNGRSEIRSVNTFLQVYLNSKFGMPCHKVYVKPEDIAKFLKVVQSVPEALLPVKWVRAVSRFSAASTEA